MQTEQRRLTENKMYGIFNELIKNGNMLIKTEDITIKNIDELFSNIYSILLDGIELDYIQNLGVDIQFVDGVTERLYIGDLYQNLIMWRVIVVFEPIKSYHIFFEDDISRSNIKKYIDTFAVSRYKKFVTNRAMNNILDDCLKKIKLIDKFSMWLANTVNLRDTVELMMNDKEVYDILHLSLKNVPLDEMGKISGDANKRLINKIKNSNHCLSQSFRTGEGTNAKQYKELSTHIGAKPDGRGGILPMAIDSSYLNGGLDNPESYWIESHAAKIAQILSKTNVGSSGHFARLLGLNNTDIELHPDPNYVCDTKNYINKYIENELTLAKYVDRYHVLEDGSLECITKDSRHLIGKTIQLRSPATCASAHDGGICYKCYGDLAYTNSDINIGKFATELLSSILTQRLLSAKHLLEAIIKIIKWNNAELFFNLFTVDGNIISIDDEQPDKFQLIIDPNEISLESEYDEKEYNEYINKFTIIHNGVDYEIYTSEMDNMYFTEDFSTMVKNKKPNSEGLLVFNKEQLEDTVIFMMIIQNNDLNKTLNRIKDIINKNAVTTSFNKDTIIDNLIKESITGGLNMMAVHMETIMANQFRALEDDLEYPDWTIPDVPYQILTLNSSLSSNPSITVTLQYSYLAKTLISPKSFKKSKPSYIDLFFMVQPHKFLVREEEIIDRNINVLPQAVCFS